MVNICIPAIAYWAKVSNFSEYHESWLNRRLGLGSCKLSPLAGETIPRDVAVDVRFHSVPRDVSVWLAVEIPGKEKIWTKHRTERPISDGTSTVRIREGGERMASNWRTTGTSTNYDSPATSGRTRIIGKFFATHGRAIRIRQRSKLTAPVL